MGEQPGTGREAHSLKPAVEHPNDSEKHDRGTEPEEEVENGGAGKADDKKRARVATIAKKAVRKLGHAIKHPVECEEEAEVGFGNVQVAPKRRHGHRQIFADQIKGGIADDAEEKDPPAPAAETGLNGGRLGESHRHWRRRLEKAQPAQKTVAGGRWCSD